MDRAALAGLLVGTRGYFLQSLSGVTPEQMQTVPEGIGHNILWNLGHVVHSLYSMTYKPCGLAMPIPETYEGLFKGGTSPKDWAETPDVDEVLGHMKNSANVIAEDLSKGTFDGFTKLDLGGTQLTSIEQVLGFHLFHEGIHMGMCMELKKLV